jgi:hypothetical protein
VVSLAHDFSRFSPCLDAVIFLTLAPDRMEDGAVCPRQNHLRSVPD